MRVAIGERGKKNGLSDEAQTTEKRGKGGSKLFCAAKKKEW